MSDCLNSDELHRFLSGKLQPARESEVATHLDQCDDCQRQAESLLDQVRLQASHATNTSATDGKAAEQPETAVLDSLHRLATPVVEDQSALPLRATLPASIGDYRILRLLAPGSTGAVYLATRSLTPVLPRDASDLVAIKLLAPECVARPLHRKRFERERNALAELPPHPNVIRVLDSCLNDETRYLVMEYAGGQNVWQLVTEQRQISIEQACRLALRAAHGLQHIHAHGLIHRDIKPSNLIVNEQGTLKIVDFGIVHHAEVEQIESRLTETNSLMGTADFMAPEQATDVRNVGHQTDIYSLGCTLAWLLTGELLFERKTIPEILAAHRKEPVPSLCERRADVPPALDSLFQRMVAKQPDDRPESAAAVVAELDSILNGDSDPGAAQVSSRSPERTSGRSAAVVCLIILGALASIAAIMAL